MCPLFSNQTHYVISVILCFYSKRFYLTSQGQIQVGQDGRGVLRYAPTQRIDAVGARCNVPLLVYNCNGL